MNITNNTVSSYNYFLNGLRSDRKKKRLCCHITLFHKFTPQKIHKTILKGGKELKGEKECQNDLPD